MKANVIAIEITKPSAPITRSPTAVTFEIVLNSVIEGLFRSLHTREYCAYFDLIDLTSFFAIVRIGWEGF